jgi:hypothetical protein
VAWHLLHAGDYLRASERGYLDGFWWRFLIHMSELFSEPPRLVTEPHFSDDGSLVDWRLVFCKDGENVVFAQRDMILLEPDWLQANKANLTEFASEAGAQRAVLVANRSGPINATMTDVGLPDNLIVDSDPDRAAERAYHALFPRHEAPEP